MRRATEVFWTGRAWRHAPDSHDREWPEEPCNACRYCGPQGLCSQPEVDKEHPYGWTCQGECGRAELEEFDEDLEPEPDSIDEYAEDASVCVQILYEDLLNRRNPLKTILAAARIYEGVPAELLEEVVRIPISALHLMSELELYFEEKSLEKLIDEGDAV